MFKEIIASKKYWKSTLLLGIGFVVVFSVIEHFLQYKGIAFETFKQDKIEGGRWIRFLLSRIVGGLLYGMILGYYFELRKRKEKR